MPDAACRPEPNAAPMNGFADSSWFESSLDLSQGLLVAEVLVPESLSLGHAAFRPAVPALWH